MAAIPTLTDPTSYSKSGLLHGFFLKLVNDPRDVVFLDLGLQCLGLAAIGVSLFFLPLLGLESFFWYGAALYVVVWFLLIDRFILMLHCTSHRMLFKRQFRKLNQVIPWVLGPFFGETPESYFVHHMGMHHPENNLEDDLSSTIKYQRDRFSHWFRYYLRFMFGTLIELGFYHSKKGNRRMVKRLYIGEGSFWLLAIGLCFVNPLASLVVFIGPVLVVRTLMMTGNWGQHAFVDGGDPGNPYKNSITCINTRYNRRCFNDGYHIFHHVKPRAHWTEMPTEFEDNAETYGKEDAVVFDGIDFFQVWLMLMFKRYRSLAKRFVLLPGAKERSEDEIVEFLKSRLVPIVS